ncbi:unnamed protein product [Dovyalis caffra]|uniref:Oberon coiled-coil region domain-containing protein n=1 Tax=Dovyalis caffra TaxID=77055 RepID=A0AAV1R2P1_9ROSI|nr:unnamed protein product [Dovyalis caffra]
MFQLKANETNLEADELQRIALAKTNKSNEEYASSYLKLRLSEVEGEKKGTKSNEINGHSFRTLDGDPKNKSDRSLTITSKKEIKTIKWKFDPKNEEEGEE